MGCEFYTAIKRNMKRTVISWVIPQLHDTGMNFRIGMKISLQYVQEPGWTRAGMTHSGMTFTKRIQSRKREPGWTCASTKVAPVLCKHPPYSASCKFFSSIYVWMKTDSFFKVLWKIYNTLFHYPKVVTTWKLWPSKLVVVIEKARLLKWGRFLSCISSNKYCTFLPVINIVLSACLIGAEPLQASRGHDIWTYVFFFSFW